MDHEAWNRCDVCGRFIAFADFDKGAIRRLVYPDSEFTRETYETLCRDDATEEERDRSVKGGGIKSGDRYTLARRGSGLVEVSGLKGADAIRWMREFR
jgi:hypothetical protein